MRDERVWRVVGLLLLAMLLLVGCSSSSGDSDETLSVQQVAALQGDPDVFVIDVRESEEYEAGHIPGVTHIPMREVAERIDEIPTGGTVIVTCRTGNRSGQVAGFLREQGYTNVHNMQGGIVAWENAGLPIER